VEADPTTQAIVSAVEQHQPKRAFIDSLTQLRYLGSDSTQARRQILALLRYLTDSGMTVMFSSEASAEAPDEDLQFLSDGIITIESNPSESQGEPIRVLRATKFRGSDFISGPHTLRIDSSGARVYPRLLPQEFQPAPSEPEFARMLSGVPELDRLLGGGLPQGSTTIISGPSGIGKITIAAQYAKEAAGLGKRSAFFSFEEPRASILQRSQALNIPLQSMRSQGKLALEFVEAATYTADEFAARLRDEVERAGSEIVAFDSIGGLESAIWGTSGNQQTLQTLCRYLNNMGVTVLLTNEVEAVSSDELQATGRGVSYLADVLMWLRYYDTDKGLRKAIGVLKKRTGDFEKFMRDLEMTPYGLKVGEPVLALKGQLGLAGNA